MVDRSIYPDGKAPNLALRQVFGRQRLLYSTFGVTGGGGAAAAGAAGLTQPGGKGCNIHASAC